MLPFSCSYSAVRARRSRSAAQKRLHLHAVSGDGKHGVDSAVACPTSLPKLRLESERHAHACLQFLGRDAASVMMIDHMVWLNSSAVAALGLDPR